MSEQGNLTTRLNELRKKAMDDYRRMSVGNVGSPWQPLERRRLIDALMKAISQRDAAYIVSWDKSFAGMIKDDDAELLAILEGK